MSPEGQAQTHSYSLSKLRWCCDKFVTRVIKDRCIHCIKLYRLNQRRLSISFHELPPYSNQTLIIGLVLLMMRHDNGFSNIEVRVNSFIMRVVFGWRKCCFKSFFYIPQVKTAPGPLHTSQMSSSPTQLSTS